MERKWIDKCSEWAIDQFTHLESSCGRVHVDGRRCLASVDHYEVSVEISCCTVGVNAEDGGCLSYCNTAQWTLQEEKNGKEEG